jgi:hypothetical protein
MNPSTDGTITFMYGRNCMIEGTLTAKVLSSRQGREKEDRIGESQPF